MIEKLIKIGLNQTEAEVYLTLLEYSRLTPANISKITGINRTTVYASLLELIKKGIIEEDSSSKIKYFIVLSPDNLANYTQIQIREIKQKELMISDLVQELELIPKTKNFSVPKVQVIQKNDIADFLYKKSMVWNQSMEDTNEKTWWGFQDHKFVENDVYKKWILWYWKNVPKGIDLKLFTNVSDVENQMKKENLEHRKLKLWKGEKFTSTQWILGEYIVSLVIEEKNHYLVQIRDRVLADSMRNLAKDLWKKS